MGPRNAPGPDVTPSSPVRAMQRGGIILVTEAAEPAEADGLRTAGFEVACVELSPGQPAGDFEVLGALTRARDQLDPARPRFVVGLGLGGLYARSFACTARGLSGAVSFQGPLVYATLTPQRPAQPMALLPGLGCPLLCHLAALDPEMTEAQVARLEERLRDCRPTALVYRYAGVAPSVFNVSDAPRAHVEARAHALAWARTRAFLAHLVAAAG